MSSSARALLVVLIVGAVLGTALAMWSDSAEPAPSIPATRLVPATPRVEGDPRHATLFGRVTDAFELPIPGCVVLGEPAPESVALEPTTPVAPTETVTDARGAFRLTLPPSERGFVLTFRHRDFPARVVWCVSAAVGSTTRVPDVELQSTQGLAITVQSLATGRMLPGARVVTRPALNDPTLPPLAAAADVRTITTDSHGIARLDALSPDGCGLAVRIEADGHETVERTVVQPDGVLPIRLREGHVLRGRVIADTGEPVPNATVRVHAEEDGPTSATQTQASGDFRIPGLPRGRYCVTVDSAHRGSLDVLDLAVPSTTVHELRLPATHELRGRVLGPDGPGPRALVRIAPTDSPAAKPRLSRCNDAGEFAFRDVPAGRYAIEASSEAGLSVPARAVTVPADPVELRLRVETAVSGRLAESDGAPEKGAKVDLMAVSGDNSAFHRFALESLGVAPPTVQPDRSGTIRPSGTVWGIARRADGSPAASATIALRTTAGREVSATRADHLGRFSLGPLAPGTYHWFGARADEDMRRLESSPDLTMPETSKSRHVLLLR